jgi:hypothetical protein
MDCQEMFGKNGIESALRCSWSNIREFRNQQVIVAKNEGN